METGKKQKKRAAGAVLAAAVLVSSALTAYAADSSQSQSMELTVQKDASYILTIPKDQTISFGVVDTDIGELSVTGSIGTKQEVKVGVSTTKFVDTEDVDNSFPFELRTGDSAFAGKAWDSREVKEESKVVLTVHIPSETWGETSPGTYRALVTFQAELLDVE